MMNYNYIEASDSYDAEREYADLLRYVEDEAYNNVIIPAYMAALDAEAKTL